jgi:hypothetical protein
MEQLPDFYAYRVRNIFQPRNRRRIDTPLHKADETNRVVCLFRELFLGKIRLKAEMGNIPAK